MTMAAKPFDWRLKAVNPMTLAGESAGAVPNEHP
jgi:hypothetical protein